MGGKIRAGEIGFAGDDVVGKAADFLLAGFVAYFGTAEDDGQVGFYAFQFCHDLRCGGDVPDIDAESDEARVFGEDRFDDIGGPMVDFEFEDFGAGSADLDFWGAAEASCATAAGARESPKSKVSTGNEHGLEGQ